MKSLSLNRSCKICGAEMGKHALSKHVTPSGLNRFDNWQCSFFFKGDDQLGGGGGGGGGVGGGGGGVDF